MVLKNNTTKMLKRLFPIALFLLIANFGFSQTPRPSQISTIPSPNQFSFACTGTQDAGTVSLGPFVGSSNDVTLSNPMYLCLGDQVQITHNGDENLSGDPDPNTPGGIGYAFYSCAPTVTGDELTDITTTDPCIYQNPVFMGPPNIPIGATNIWIAATASNDVTILNNGGLQDGFNGGAPVQFWYAPITFDALGASGVEAIHEEVGASGTCVNARVDQAFSVVYLNEISITNELNSFVDNEGNTITCGGSFTVSGGLPEFDPSVAYNISITRDGNPMDMGTVVSGSASNGENVEFTINVPGVYNISITDGKGCPANTTIDITGCPAVEMSVGDETATPGSVVCVPVTVVDFDGIESFQYTVEWDPAILQFQSLNAVALDQIDFVFNAGVGTLTISYLSDILNPQPVTLTDGTVAFEICFTVVGPVGSMSPIDITGSLTTIDVNSGQVGLIANNGSVTVVNVGAFDIDVTGTDPLCAAEANGTFTVTVNGTGDGVAPYSVTWAEVGNVANNGTLGPIAANSNETQSGLVAGTYALIISDSSVPAITDLDTITLTDPPSLGASITFSEPILCFGDLGEFTANVILGSSIVANPGPEYEFLWSPGNVTTQTIAVDPTLGAYGVTITNANDCEAIAVTTPAQPAALTVSLSVTDAACSGVNNGQIVASPMGGTVAGDYEYEWSTTPVQTTQTATNLGIGSYTVTVTDDNNCETIVTEDVGGATILVANAAIQNVTCNGLDNGEIEFNPTAIGIDNGGYTYQWSPNVSGTNNATGLAPGTFTTTITDALGCNIDTTITIIEPTTLEIVGMVATTDETCIGGGSDGTATVTVTGGTPSVTNGYTFSWNCCPTETSNMATGIPQGDYTITVLDSLGCSTFAPFTINPPTPPTITSFDSMSVSCPTTADGELTVNAMIGNAAIDNYSWTLPDGSTASGQTISNLAAGTYTVTVTSVDGCEVTGSATLFAPAPLVVTAPASPANPSCNGASDGTATVLTSGGTTPYSYQWSDDAGNSTNAVVPNLSAGTYFVTVVDAEGCDQQVVEVVLVDPPVIDIVFTDSTFVSCPGQVANCDGTAMALASGGTPGPNTSYTFIWESGEVTTGMNGMASQLCEGFQLVTVQDANNCASIDSVFIGAPAPIALSPDTELTQPTCNGDADGSIDALAIGGTPGYMYDWGGGNTDPLLDNITAGSYPITITDFNNCTFETTIDLGEPDVFLATINIDSTNNITCNGEQDGQIYINYTGGNGPAITYDWPGNIAPTTSNIASGLSAGTYIVTVSDSKGCEDIVQYTVTEPIPIFAVIPTPLPPLCNGEQTLVMVDTAAGGTGGPYFYNIDGGPWQNIENVINVFAGDHIINIRDGANCEVAYPLSISEPPPITVDLGPDVEIQLGESYQINGSTNVALSSIDTIIWTPAIFDSVSCVGCLNPIVSPLDNTLYTVEVFDDKGCNGNANILVEVDKNRNVFIPNVFTPNGDGFNDIFQVFSGPGVTQINYVKIFDRWGEVVYEANNIFPTPFEDFDNSWDGKFKGRIMNPGVFVYLIEVTFEDGITLLYRGDVTLLH